MIFQMSLILTNCRIFIAMSNGQFSTILPKSCFCVNELRMCISCNLSTSQATTVCFNQLSFDLPLPNERNSNMTTLNLYVNCTVAMMMLMCSFYLQWAVHETILLVSWFLQSHLRTGQGLHIVSLWASRDRYRRLMEVGRMSNRARSVDQTDFRFCFLHWPVIVNSSVVDMDYSWQYLKVENVAIICNLNIQMNRYIKMIIISYLS